MCTDAKVSVHVKFRPRIIFVVKFFAEPCDEHNGIFKPLALVNRHNAHDVIIFAERGGSRHIVAKVAQFFKMVDEP